MSVSSPDIKFQTQNAFLNSEKDSKLKRLLKTSIPNCVDCSSTFSGQLQPFFFSQFWTVSAADMATGLSMSFLFSFFLDCFWVLAFSWYLLFIWIFAYPRTHVYVYSLLHLKHTHKYIYMHRVIVYICKREYVTCCIDLEVPHLQLFFELVCRIMHTANLVSWTRSLLVPSHGKFYNRFDFDM